MDKITDFSFALQNAEQTHSTAYRIAPNVVVARNPQPPREHAPMDDWQLLLAHSGARIQGGMRTRKGAVELWAKMCELAGITPADGLPTSDADAVEILRPAIFRVRGWDGRPPEDGIDWK